MRWPWRRTVASTAPEVPAVPVRGDWRRVGDLRPTADPYAPTLIPAGLPVLASTRSMLHRERTEPPAPSVPAGRVTGLAAVVPSAPTESAPVPVRHSVRTAVLAQAPRRVTLTRAVAEYVAEPRVPAVPHRAPAWLRTAAQPQVMTPLDAFVSPAPEPPEVALLDSWISPSPPVGLPEPKPEPEVEVTPPVPMIRRRRRPGLGLPLPPGERPPAAPDEPARSPKPPRPVLVKPEPTPVPPVPEPAPMVIDLPVPAAEGAAGPELVHRAVPGRFSARIPNDLAETFERAYGVEVADVTVDRSPAAGERAKAIGAKAFAHHELIVLPDEVGPVESVEARALLGHELAHVVQQRTIGALPTESDVDGQRLEAAARSVEEWVRAGASGPPPPAVPPEASGRPGPRPVRRRASADPPSGVGAPQRAAAGVATDPAPPLTAARVVTNTAAPTSTQAAPATLIHPTQNQPDPPNGQGYGSTVGNSFAQLGADMFGLGGLVAAPAAARPTTTPQINPPATATTPSTSAGQVSQPAGSSFGNRDARRDQLQNDALERMNMVREQQGQAPLTELPPTELAAIESQLDAEGSGGGPNNAPVVHNWSEMREEFLVGGGGALLGSFIGYNPAERQHHAETDAARAQPANTSTTGAAATGAAVAAQQSVGHPDRAANLEPTGAELARLYDRIHTRLVRELLVGRERAGSLMDFR